MTLIDLFGTKGIETRTWDDCKDKFKQFAEEHNALNRQNNGDASELLFRGLPNSCYELTTTLDRYVNVRRIGIGEYYEAIKMIRPEVETLTNKGFLTGLIQFRL